MIHLGTYKIFGYTIQTQVGQISGSTIHYYNLQGEKILIEEYYGENRPEYTLATT